MNQSQNIHSEIITVTPAKAKKLLEANVANRKVSQRNLDAVKTSLARGEWKLNGEAIKIDSTGKVLDGQHRLMACVETGISFQTLIVTGLPNDTQETMDRGKSRSIADVLSLRGYKRTAALAAIVAAIIRSEQWSVKAASAMGGSAYPVTAQQVVNRLEAEPSLTDMPRIVAGVARIGLSSRLAGLLYYKFSEVSPDDAAFFFERLETGDGLVRGDAILALRNKLIDLHGQKAGTKSPSYICGLTIKAWNKFLAGETAQLIRFNPGGAQAEPFPTISSGVEA